MKKLIIGLSGVVILALAVVLFVNAGTGSDETKKATTEVKADCAKCPSAAPCCDKEKSETAATATTKACCPDATQTAASSSCATSCPMKKATVTQ